MRLQETNLKEVRVAISPDGAEHPALEALLSENAKLRNKAIQLLLQTVALRAKLNSTNQSPAPLP